MQRAQLDTQKGTIENIYNGEKGWWKHDEIPRVHMNLVSTLKM
jgi:hypothetical protein